MMTDIEFWKSKWSEAQHNSSLNAGYNRSDNWEKFWNSYAGRYAHENRERFPFYQGIVDHLEKEGIISPSCEVLDIGCGPGTFSIPLALKATTVTGLDTAPEMLAVMKYEAARVGVAESIKTISGTWEAFPEETKYDLVIGANTPAIMDYGSLMKMNRLSLRHCCLISFASSYQSTLRRELWHCIMGAPLKSQAFDIQFPFNILYLHGCFPNIRFFPYCWEPSYESQEIIDHYIEYFTLFGKQGEAVEQEVRKFIINRQQNGSIKDCQQGVMAVTWWHTNPGN